MNLKAKFHCKDTKIDVKPCTVEKVIELNENDYSHFCQNLLEEYDFIKENTDCMYQGTDNVRHCLLILGENHDDGVLVDAQGYGYARYTAYLPDARIIARQLQYPSLNAFENEMCSLIDKYTRKAVDGQIDCQYRIDFDEVRNLCRHNGFNEELFMDMLSDRDEINDVEYSDDGCTVTISEPYLRAEDEQGLRMLDPEEIEIMCAKHILWLHDAGGEQADFSNCLIKDWNLSGKNLINAVFDGAKILNTKLENAEMCFASCNNTRFYNCVLINVVAEEAEFKNAECIACDFDYSTLTHSDFTGAKFYDCTMKNGSLQNCCLDKTDFGNMEFGNVNTSGCSYDEQEWSAESPGENISM